ncbi:MAG: hypothetical protein FWG43_04190 [Clostridiales bacterium]|nr:hypothetical protein [Clostridiales bacterium]
MKTIFAIFITIIITLALLGGCNSEKPPEALTNLPSAANPDTLQTPNENPAPGITDLYTKPQGFLFIASGQDIYVSSAAQPILANLPQPKSTFEAGSCAFEGEDTVDITYFYPGFELTTFSMEGIEYVFSIVLTDDSITTPEGIYIGGGKEDVIKAYGENYTQTGEQFTYRQDKGSLIFTFEEDIIIGIVYTLVI